ncbi:PqqD family protein [Roseovarius sp. D22-M7]|uniref:PqqD family protein n=1 Tax=Roseovarius sp. D22-M7 TaxID=3127116 RepID=UPI0030102B6E
MKRLLAPLAALRRRRLDLRAHRLAFRDVPQILSLIDAEAIAPALETVMPDWARHSPDTRVATDAPVTRISGTGSGHYLFQSWWSRTPLSDLGVAGATSGAVADLVQSYCDTRPDLLALHCGAARIGSHLVALTGPYRAGKSTLVARLAADPDVALFCDDILPVAPDGAGIALGIQPRLRLPLPPGMQEGVRAALMESLTVQDHRYGFVRSTGQAPLETRVPLDALIVLRREPGKSARLHAMAPADAAACLIRQNVADPGEAEAQYDRLTALANRLVCLCLVYSDLEEAAAFVRHACAGPTLPAPDVAIAPPLPQDATEPPVTPTDLSRVFCRDTEVSERVIGTDTFLWQMAGRDYFRLNPVAGAVWRLLEQPMRGHAILDTLNLLFEDTPRDTITHDLAALLGQMLARDLVRVTDQRSSCRMP